MKCTHQIFTDNKGNKYLVLLDKTASQITYTSNKNIYQVQKISDEQFKTIDSITGQLIGVQLAISNSGIKFNDLELVIQKTKGANNGN
ncbi:Hypothetical protein MAGb_3040 [Mycoplasmopsis agalactiae 14628]|uniref:Uncharacterized protein n=1 Tax=Mycoplasmopsis agalactiae 14628 TaxID=1110504 RepID=I5D686_MYCAA|nr:hypothetical protein [Mycoplasmopsis agalactiae]EIN15195.1 Hypothetical protein MAGb_3040 [Mycoplasmopsis agalactiae 14628]